MSEANKIEKEARQHLDRREFRSALESYKRLVRLDPSRLNAYRALIEAYVGLGLIPEAAQQFRALADHYRKNGMENDLRELRNLAASLGIRGLEAKAEEWACPPLGLNLEELIGLCDDGVLARAKIGPGEGDTVLVPVARLSAAGSSTATEPRQWFVDLAGSFTLTALDYPDSGSRSASDRTAQLEEDLGFDLALAPVLELVPDANPGESSETETADEVPESPPSEGRSSSAEAQIECPRCGEPIKESATKCPHCLKVPIDRRWLELYEWYEKKSDRSPAEAVFFSREALGPEDDRELERIRRILHRRRLRGNRLLLAFRWIASALVVLFSESLRPALTDGSLGPPPLAFVGWTLLVFGLSLVAGGLGWALVSGVRGELRAGNMQDQLSAAHVVVLVTLVLATALFPL